VGGDLVDLDGDTARTTTRVALLHYTVPPVTGGVELVLTAQRDQLREAGYDVRVVAGRGDADVVLPEVDSQHPDVQRVTRALSSQAEPPAAFEELRERIAAGLEAALGDRDVVVAHNVLTMPFNLPLTAALLDQRARIVAWTHDLLWTNANYAAFQRTDWPWRLLAERQPGVTYVAISEARQQEISRTMGIPPREVSVVPNGIDKLSFGEVGGHARDLLRAADAEDADPLILVPQRVTTRKRLELVIETAHELVADWPDLRVVVTGPVDPHDLACRRYAQRLLELRSERGLERVVRFLFESADDPRRHPVGFDDVTQLYRLSDLVLLPSESEGFGLPLLEAALSRVPVVCSDLPVFREVAAGGAEMFPKNAGAAEIAAVVSRTLASRPIRHRRSVIERYAWPRILEAIEQVIAAPPAGPGLAAGPPAAYADSRPTPSDGMPA
jgi:mannosylglucosylglycerate synthase